MITIVVVDDDTLVREALVAFTREAFPHYAIRGSDGGRSDVEEWQSYPPTLLILDLLLGQQIGLEVIESLPHQQSRFLMTSAFYRPALLEKAKVLGAHGFVAKSTAPEIFWQAIRTILAGGDFWPQNNWQPARQLAPIDRRIVGLVAEGLTNSEIGRLCHLAPGTVRNRLARLMDDLGARNRAQIVRYAIEWRLLDDY